MTEGGVTALLADDGPFADVVDGFQARPEQQQMAEAVAEVIADGEVLVAEAGTGIGKTFAYLVPALNAGRKTIVATGTKTLQDQLYHRDLPLVSRALQRSLRPALLKGRANYLCLYRMEMTAEEGRFVSREQVHQLQRIREWAGITRSGDINEAPVNLAESSLLPQVTSTAENCLGTECPLYGDCFLMEARKRAQEADVVVINHHLLMADWAVKEGGFGEVLPSADVYILDEAHQLPDVASQFFGLSLGSRQLTELVRDTLVEYQREAGDVPEIPQRAEALGQAVKDFRLALGQEGRREPWAAVCEDEGVTRALETLADTLTSLEQGLAPMAERGKGLESCHRRAAEFSAALDEFLNTAASDYVQWFETYTQAFILRLTPLEVSNSFRGQMARHQAAWVFTSATLSVNDRFDHYTARLGLGEPRTLQLASPFDYPNNAIFYLPQELPPPNAPDFQTRFLECATRVLEASQGRAFLLFTSHRALQHAAQWLPEHVDFPLLVQGSQSQNRLLEAFREQGNAVLLGTQSFWEGVDVRGEALSCVMIDRLPFASPGDPVVQARIDALRREDKNPFMTFQVPQAVIALRQGVGRLIRDAGDRGVLMVGDIRLVTKPYGRTFIDSLPPMRRTRSLQTVQRFFSAEAAGAGGRAWQ
ncbi:ATP-dependent DNA helicase [Ectothiorhodospiraceae bacterium WFHF3C12]|nr:ATP-dependent DNA helicase [Ectothiorhodospiraceae bacterium WFHF3C12]